MAKEVPKVSPHFQNRFQYTTSSWTFARKLSQRRIKPTIVPLWRTLHIALLWSSFIINFLGTNGKKERQALFDNYTKYDIWCHQFLLYCSILTINRGVVSPTLNVNPTLLVIPCKKTKHYKLTMWQVLTKWVFIQNFNHLWWHLSHIC